LPASLRIIVIMNRRQGLVRLFIVVKKEGFGSQKCRAAIKPDSFRLYGRLFFVNL
jgi:hypothetical protein